MSSYKAGSSLLRQGFWPRCQPSPSSSPLLSSVPLQAWRRNAPTAGMRNSVDGPPSLPCRHRHLSSTVDRKEPSITPPSTTSKHTLSPAALETISAFLERRTPRGGTSQDSPQPETSVEEQRPPKNSADDINHFYSMAIHSREPVAMQSQRSPRTVPPMDLKIPHARDDVVNGGDKPPMRLSPALGRTVVVNRASGMDLFRALNILKSRVSQNQIRNDAMRQRFHERPGLKKKRLRIRRWRTKFMIGFRSMVRSVQRMKRQGW